MKRWIWGAAGALALALFGLWWLWHPGTVEAEPAAKAFRGPPLEALGIPLQGRDVRQPVESVHAVVVLGGRADDQLVSVLGGVPVPEFPQHAGHTRHAACAARLGPIGVDGPPPVAADRFDVRGGLERVSVPCRIVHGAEDEMVPLQRAMELQREIGSAEISVLENVAHFPQLEDPERLSRAIRRIGGQLTRGTGEGS